MSSQFNRVSAILLALLIVSSAAAAYSFLAAPTATPAQKVTVTKTATATATVGGGAPITTTQTIINTATQTVAATTTQTVAKTVTPSLVDLAKKEGKVVFAYVYTAIPKTGIFEKFKEKYGITVEGIKMSTDDVFPRISSEYAAGKHTVDVIQFNPARAIIPLAQQGIIAQYFSPEAEPYPKDLKDPMGFWLGWNPSPYMITYNTKFVKPDEVKKLDIWSLGTDPIWKGRVGIRAWTSGFSSPVLVGLYNTWGEAKVEQWLKSLHGNQKPLVHSDDGFLRELMAKGEIHVLFPNSGSTNLLQMKEGAPYNYVDDKPGSVVSFIIGGAVLRDSPNPNAARLFFDFLTSAEGQGLMGKFIEVGRPGVKFPAEELAKNRQNWVFVPEDKFIELWPKVKGVWDRVRQQLGL